MKLEAINVIPRIEGYQFEQPLNFTINDGEHWAFIGPNGAGKTIFADILANKYGLKQGEILYDGKHPRALSGIVKTVSFRDIYSIADIQNSFYQQRWNKGLEMEASEVSGIFTDADENFLSQLLEWFGAEDLLKKKINLLSSGELRKTLIIRVLLSDPKVLIIDNPYIGLDEPSRNILNDVLQRLTEMQKVQIILILSDPANISQIITHVLPIKNGKIFEVCAKEKFLEDEIFIESLFAQNEDENNIDLSSHYSQTKPDFEHAVVMNNVGIKYDERTILRNLNWTVSRGEKWCLSGANGSGKSTLLSLVLGDNPQAYANDITLFDRKRGSGESIWDIKKRIGYVSPEMHLFYLKNNKTKEIVSSGFFDTIGLHQKVDEEKEQLALKWMQKFGISYLAEKPFLKISFGEQRLALLVRAFVKNPDLLILDEPLHGLDIAFKEKVINIIENFCDEEKTLIYVTHYKEEIPKIVSKYLHLEKQQ